MFENPFEEKIQQLKVGEIVEIVVEKNDFDLFREAWKILPDRTRIVGEAGLNGRIIYRLTD
ncbi:hypothetical protein IW492_07240 [Enterococcus sp. BWB1-3]|uniref:hypothetical protein n=1 Tax=unclassified Enterococcus TaxID=2608891 RepID=UPI001923A807|nr:MULTISPECIES: hypothetical protein [unclassified Enterococcus]MBL1229027.1 hypothetical protein [Enterococcus sp. BWB1-3]MCB5952296.1 hypothetical protein [Enterococcus sp. BWT-B8]MCB5955475.1 hypothetical protein [Enterococcus sp. CWB-B31]